jgi:hypothetical protein
MHSTKAAFSSSLCISPVASFLFSIADTWAPIVSSFFSPPAPSSISVASGRLTPPNSKPRDAASVFYSPALSPPLNPPPLTPQAINGVKLLNVNHYCLTTASPVPPTPIKGRAPPLVTPAPFPLIPELSLALVCARTELESPPIHTAAASLHRHRSCSGEPLIGFTSSFSSSPTFAGDLWFPVAPGTLRTDDAPTRGCPRCHRFTVDPGHVIGPWDLPLESNSRNRYSSQICKEALRLL